MTANIGTRAEWLAARRDLLDQEKELSRVRDELARQRRELPWVPIDADYVFATESGPARLIDLFDGRTQLAVYHFMFGPEWDAGCPSCSFWLDSFDGVRDHLAHRDVTLIAASRAPLDRLLAYRSRMGWTIPWVSTLATTFNQDFNVSFPAEAPVDAPMYNFAPASDPGEEAPGLSTFTIADGRVFHTYSTYARGLDVFNSAYQILDAMPMGRDEADLEWSMAWLRRHDEYETDGRTT